VESSKINDSIKNSPQSQTLDSPSEPPVNQDMNIQNSYQTPACQVETVNKDIEQELSSASDQLSEAKPHDSFEPLIIAFCCNWCSYAGADLAGVSRLQYPPNVRIIRVLCSGRIEPDYVLRTLELGADGVLVAGCHPGDCHYISGNLKAEIRFKMLVKLLDLLGINPKRARLEWISASEGPKFAGTITEFVEEIKELGPNKFKNAKNIIQK
jgi:F420-non-reducing hydrogenase iron-sulfur subunit